MIYDCFMYNGEADILEIRLNMLAPFVDFFVIGESHETFSGKPKPMYPWEQSDRFAKWEDKIVHVYITPKDFPDSFQRAHHQKERLKDGIWDPKGDDIIYFGDVDEIWKPQQITDDKVYNLEQLNYGYYLNYRSSERWVGTIVGKWKTIKTNTFTHWRATHTNEIPDAGWHFTNMGGVEAIKVKLESYDHQEYNNDGVKVLLEDRMKDGEDYVGRTHDWEGKPFSFEIDESQLPTYILDNKLRYGHLFK